MKRRIQLLAAGLASAALALGAAGAQPDAKADPKYKTMDAGPGTIEVSKYPAEQQANYQVFAAKCAKCHTLARPINSDYVLPDEWERYIKRMMRKPGSGISSGDGKKIFEFLKYDSQTRKKELYEKKLKESAEADKKK